MPIVTTSPFKIDDTPSMFIKLLGGIDHDYAHNVTLDTSGNIYITGYTQSQGAGGQDVLVVKYDNTGSVLWQRALGTGNADIGWSVATDSSDDVYIAGQLYTGSDYNALIAKYNSSGTIQWQRTLSTGSADYGYSVITDTSNNVYLGGRTVGAGAGSGDVFVAKYNSSGAIQWQRTLGGTNNDWCEGLGIDGSDNIYVAGRTASEGEGSYDLLIAKYNSSGTIQWQRILGSGVADYMQDIAVTSSGDIYVIAYTAGGGAGSSDCLIAKYNTSGTIQWQRFLGGASNEFGNGITLDGSGNIYITAQTASAGEGGAYDVLIAKYNSSGAIQWQRTLGGTGADLGYSVATDTSGNVYLCGITDTAGEGNYDILLTKLPSDGSGTGTYGDFVYQTSALTDQAASLTGATSTLTDQSSSLTDASSSLTDQATTLTETNVL